MDFQNIQQKKTTQILCQQHKFSEINNNASFCWCFSFSYKKTLHHMGTPWTSVKSDMLTEGNTCTFMSPLFYTWTRWKLTNLSSLNHAMSWMTENSLKHLFTFLVDIGVLGLLLVLQKRGVGTGDSVWKLIKLDWDSVILFFFFFFSEFLRLEGVEGWLRSWNIHNRKIDLYLCLHYWDKLSNLNY